MSGIRIKRKFSYNHIYIIHSDKPGDLKTAAPLKELVDEFYRESPTTTSIHDVRSPYNLEELILRILVDCLSKGVRPIIHIEAHGDPDIGLELWPDPHCFIGGGPKYFGWDKLMACLRPINQILDGQLLVVVAACHAINSLLAVSITERAPYCAFVGPKQSISAAAVEAAFRMLYLKLSQQSDLLAAIQAMGTEIDYIISEAVFIKAFASYLTNHATGKGRRERIDLLLDQAMTIPQISAALGVNATRKLFRNHTRPCEKQFEVMKRKFLGDTSPIAFEDVMDHLFSQPT